MYVITRGIQNHNTENTPLGIDIHNDGKLSNIHFIELTLNNVLIAIIKDYHIIINLQLISIQQMIYII